MTLKQWAIWLAWALPPIALISISRLAPEAITRSGDAGTFISAEVHPGDWFSPGITVIETTRGTLVLDGLVSAARGQPVAVRDSTRNGLEACIANAGCTPMAGSYAGAMTILPHRGRAIPHVVNDGLRFGAYFWLWVGLPIWLVVFWTSTSGGKRDEIATADR